MKLSSVAAVTVVFATSAAWAQSASPSMASHASRSNPRTVIATSNATGLAQISASPDGCSPARRRHGSTLVKMHALLKQMEVKNKNGASKDPMIKANLEMWGLMLQDLDNSTSNYVSRLAPAKTWKHGAPLCTNKLKQRPQRRLKGSKLPVSRALR